MKPLGQKAYGSIPHLPGSRLGPGDYCISEGQARIATLKKRDRHDVIIVQEKLDGSNCSVAKVNGKIYALGRSGYLASTSQYLQHRIFALWVEDNRERFEDLLNEGERVCGEWLAMAHGTKYELIHEPFVVFDLMTKTERVPWNDFRLRIADHGFTKAQTLSLGEPLAVDTMIKLIKTSAHGAIDPVEGAIWRVERKGKVDFLCKYVHHFKQDGKYFAEVCGETVWNIDIEPYQERLALTSLS